jgi:hypothetical protein
MPSSTSLLARSSDGNPGVHASGRHALCVGTSSMNGLISTVQLHDREARTRGRPPKHGLPAQAIGLIALRWPFLQTNRFFADVGWVRAGAEAPNNNLP